MCAMDDKPMTYHTATMTINGVTKNVIVPVPKSKSHSRVVTANLPNGSTVFIRPTQNSATDKCATAVANTNNATFVTVALPNAMTSALLTGQHSPLLSAGTSSNKRSIITITKRPINCYQLPGDPSTSVVSAAPRLMSLLTSSNATVTVESPSVQRRTVPILPPTVAHGRCLRLPVSLRPPLSTRPIILRRNQPSVTRSVTAPVVHVVRPLIHSPASSVATAVDSLSSMSGLTVVSSPRTLSHREAVAVGWYKPEVQQASDDVIEPVPSAALDDTSYAVQHILPMDTDCHHLSDISDANSQHKLKSFISDSAADKLCSDTDEFAAAAEGMCVDVIDHETQMKVIEIIPDDAGDVDEEEYARPSVKIKDECVNDVLVDNDLGRQHSSASTETAVSDSEQSTSIAEDFVVLAEWSQDDLMITSSTADRPIPTTASKRCTKRRKRKKYGWFRNKRSSSSTSVYKARRTGGRPQTTEERYGIVDSFVSLPVLRLEKPSVDIRNWKRYVCCPKTQIQRCERNSVPRSAVSQETSSPKPRSFTVADGSKIHKLDEASELIQPSLVASGSATLPVQRSGPTSVDGVTPLVVRQPDGKLAKVVATRAAAGDTASDANKKKYLLIKANSGSFLVPVNNVHETSNTDLATPNVKSDTSASPPTTLDKVTPHATATDPSGHRQRIQQLKERLRQQEEQLKNIRNQRTGSDVQKLEFDSTSYY